MTHQGQGVMDMHGRNFDNGRNALSGGTCFGGKHLAPNSNSEFGATTDKNDNPVVTDVGLINSEWHQMRQSPSTGGQTVGRSKYTTSGTISSSDLFRSHTEDQIPKVSKHKRLLKKEQKETKKAEDVENYKGNLSLEQLIDFIGGQNVPSKKSKKLVNKPDDNSNTHKPNKKNKGKKQNSSSSNGVDLVELQGHSSTQPGGLCVHGDNIGNTSIKTVIPIVKDIDRLSQKNDDIANLLNLQKDECTTKTSVSTLEMLSKVCNDDTNKEKEYLAPKSNSNTYSEKINNGKGASEPIDNKIASSEKINKSKKLLESKAKTDRVEMPNNVTRKQKNAKNKKAKQTDPAAKPASESSMLDSYHESSSTKTNRDAYIETLHNGNAANKKINNEITSIETIGESKKLLESKDETVKFEKHCSNSVENVSVRFGVPNNVSINQVTDNRKVRPTNPSATGISDNHLIFTDIEVSCVPIEYKFETVGKKNNTANEISQENNFLKSVANHKKNRRYDKHDKCQIPTNIIGKKPPICTQCSAVDSDVHVHDSNPSAFLALKSGRKSFQVGHCNSATGLKIQNDSNLEPVRSLPLMQNSPTLESALSSRLSYAATSIKQSDQGSPQDGVNSHEISSNAKTPTLCAPSVAHKKDKGCIVHHVSLQQRFAAKHTKNGDTVTCPSVQSHEKSNVKSGNSGGYGKKHKSVIFLDKRVEQISTSLGLSFGFEVEPVDIYLSHVEVIDTINSVKLESEQTYLINDVHSQENIQLLDNIKYVGYNDLNPPSASSNTSMISNGSVQNLEAKVRKSSKHLVTITSSHLYSQENIQFLEDEKNIENDTMSYLSSASSSNASVISNGLQHEDIHVDKFSQSSKFRDYVYYGESVTTVKKEIERPSQTNGPTKYCGVVKYREEINLKSNFNFAEALMFLNTEWDKTRILCKNQPSKLVILE